MLKHAILVILQPALKVHRLSVIKGAEDGSRLLDGYQVLVQLHLRKAILVLPFFFLQLQIFYLSLKSFYNSFFFLKAFFQNTALFTPRLA